MVLEILSRPGTFLFFSFDIAEVISFWEITLSKYILGLAKIDMKD
jgi:hypothetical protein